MAKITKHGGASNRHEQEQKTWPTETSSASSEKPQETAEMPSVNLPSPARTTESPSEKDQEASSIARSTGGSTRETESPRFGSKKRKQL